MKNDSTGLMYEGQEKWSRAAYRESPMGECAHLNFFFKRWLPKPLLVNKCFFFPLWYLPRLDWGMHCLEKRCVKKKGRTACWFVDAPIHGTVGVGIRAKIITSTKPKHEVPWKLLIFVDYCRNTSKSLKTQKVLASRKKCSSVEKEVILETKGILQPLEGPGIYMHTYHIYILIIYCTCNMCIIYILYIYI